MQPSRQPSLTRCLSFALALAAVSCLLLGPVRGLLRDRSANSAHLKHRLYEWEPRLRQLVEESERDRSFKPAFGLLMNLVAMTECLGAWRGLAAVEAPPGLRDRLENAYLMARARAGTRLQHRRMRDMEWRYEEALILLRALPQGPRTDGAFAMEGAPAGRG